MSSIQFNYFADEKGEQIIRQELLNKFGSLYVRNSWEKNGNILESIVKNVTDFAPFLGKTMLLTSDNNKTKIIEYEDRFVRKYDSPVIEYFPSGMKEDKYYSGRLAYFGANEFPEFKKDVQSLFRKLKKQCWKGSSFHWVFETIGDEATVFIPNTVVHLKKG
ncbi:hypothetical protein [Capnocytophaga canis]|uniref:hypothetical protein n=1 Tax=Capnocytophaga canis TaxID=1848903 RepID=UPI001562BE91|nr:hypothetical protein [Capnocytophaga canis]